MKYCVRWKYDDAYRGACDQMKHFDTDTREQAVDSYHRIKEQEERQCGLTSDVYDFSLEQIHDDQSVTKVL